MIKLQEKLCSLCEKKHYAKNLCFYHYKKSRYIYKWKEINENGRKCIHKSKKLYHTQYAFNTIPRKFGHRHKCRVENCNISVVKNYCRKHKYRIENNLPLNNLIDCRHLRVGKKNNLWRGGVSEYPNHSLMKKNRLIILIQNPKCEICKTKNAIQIHHKDFSTNNHNLFNLMAICSTCHQHIHHLRAKRKEAL